MKRKFTERFKGFTLFYVSLYPLLILGVIVLLTDIVSKEFTERALVVMILSGIGTLIGGLIIFRHIDDEEFWRIPVSKAVRKFLALLFISYSIGFIVIPTILLLV